MYIIIPTCIFLRLTGLHYDDFVELVELDRSGVVFWLSAVASSAHKRGSRHGSSSGASGGRGSEGSIHHGGEGTKRHHKAAAAVQQQQQQQQHQQLQQQPSVVQEEDEADEAVRMKTSKLYILKIVENMCRLLRQVESSQPAKSSPPANLSQTSKAPSPPAPTPTCQCSCKQR